jgi:hypothetical protein
MTGVLYAKVGGTWVPVTSGGGDEVWVGPDDPGASSPYEIWYDTDDDGPQYGNYAHGVTNLGFFNISTGTTMPTSGRTVIATVQNFYYVSGRRYRLFIELNAITSSSGTSSGWFDIAVDGTAQGGGVHHQATTTSPGSHQHFTYEFYLEKYGMSAGLHTLTVGFTPTVGQMTIYNDVGTIEIRDVGPSNPMNPLTQTTPPPWIPFPFATGWSNYLNTYTACGYRKLGDMVFLRGLARVDAGATSLIGTLPTGYRPPAASIFSPQCAGGSLRMDINASGTVTNGAVVLTIGNWVSLENTQFSVTPGN